MQDDAFHLTPHDVRAQEFQRVLRGFDPLQVESFKQRVAEEMDRMVREKVQMDERLRGMIEQLRAFRDRERAMNDALVAAQQLREEIRTQADREAEAILAEARLSAERIVQDAAREETMLRERVEALRRQFGGYVSAFRMILSRHLGELDVIEGGMAVNEDGTPARPAAPGTPA